jgi:3-hydroxybutyryl-CoA dehydratase
MEGKTHTKKFQISDETVRQFAEASHDRNPIHLDEEYAKGSIFKKRVCHGMLIAGLFSAVIGNEFPGQGTIYVTFTSLRP